MWGLFRQDAETFDSDTVLQGNWYGTELDALMALELLKDSLPLLLKNTVMTKEVKINPADQKKFHSYAAPS
jgi:hypothetical protein